MIEKRVLRFQKMIADLSISPWRSLWFCFTCGAGPVTRMAFLGPSQNILTTKINSFEGEPGCSRPSACTVRSTPRPACHNSSASPKFVSAILILVTWCLFRFAYVYQFLCSFIAMPVTSVLPVGSNSLRIVCSWTWTLRHFSFTGWQVVMLNSVSRWHQEVHPGGRGFPFCF